MRHVPTPLYWLIRKLVPIACIDVLPYDPKSGRVYLITRHDADGYALVGGAIRRGEYVHEAVRRHLHETLTGPDLGWDDPETARPMYAAQFFPDPGRGDGHDPRKHAVALTYLAAQRSGEVTGCGGDATAFDAVSYDRLPPDHEFAYGHGHIARVLVERLTGQDQPVLHGPP
jgi:ADP-ribose pyrophosphatase YjhB (NUDIX family)